MSESKKDENEVRELAHDIVNSLTIIMGKLQIGLKSDEIEKVRDNITLSLQLLSDVGHLCKETIGNTEVESFYLDMFLKGVIEECRKVRPNIQIQTTSNQLVQVKTSKILLKNAIHNIVKNSSEAGATKIKIECSKEKICFIDNGPGISKEKALEIKSKGTTKANSTQHGLGLLSIARFCRKQKWKLHIHNNPNTDYFPSGFTVEFIF